MLRLTSSGFGREAGDGADGVNDRGDNDDFGVVRPDSTDSPGGAELLTLDFPCESFSTVRLGEEAAFFGELVCVPHALGVSVLVVGFEADPVVDVDAVAHPRGDFESNCSLFKEKLPNCNAMLVVAPVSQRPSFKYFGLAALLPVGTSERATGISFGDAGLTDVARGDGFSVEVIKGLLRPHALVTGAAFFSVVVDQSPIEAVDTSNDPHPEMVGDSSFFGDNTFSGTFCIVGAGDATFLGDVDPAVF